MQQKLYSSALDLLRTLIETPSLSRQEADAAGVIECALVDIGVGPFRKGNNVWAYNKFYNKNLPTILLNSHIDTVKPSSSYTLDPYKAIEKDGKLYGLGSNDAGASVVALFSTFIHFYDKQNLKYNLCLALTAEEEISGSEGIESILGDIGAVDFAIVGEPTGMNMAVSERGLLVVDCLWHGIAGHAARAEGVNAIYGSIDDLRWFRDYRFDRISDMLGEVKMSLTQIESGSQHNVVPDLCKAVVDIRVTECYTHAEIIDIIKLNTSCDIKPRSLRLKPSSININHPIIAGGIGIGLETFGSPTLSDQALLSCPSLKMGVGDSCRSHSADEYVFIEDIYRGIDLYIRLLDAVL